MPTGKAQELQPEQSGQRTIIAFKGQQRLGSGRIADVAKQLKARVDAGELPNYLIFDQATGLHLDLDFSGSVAELEQRYGTQDGAQSGRDADPEAPRGRGRPKLGVVGREITLLPRHWEWLDKQRGGASATLRRLIEAERKRSAGDDRVKQAQDSTNRFIYAMAGNLEGFEEAVRALYAGDKAAFAHHIRRWPAAIRESTVEFAREAFPES